MEWTSINMLLEHCGCTTITCTWIIHSSIWHGLIRKNLHLFKLFNNVHFKRRIITRSSRISINAPQMEIRKKLINSKQCDRIIPIFCVYLICVPQTVAYHMYISVWTLVRDWPFKTFNLHIHYIVFPWKYTLQAINSFESNLHFYF